MAGYGLAPYGLSSYGDRITARLLHVRSQSLRGGTGSTTVVLGVAGAGSPTISGSGAVTVTLTAAGVGGPELFGTGSTAQTLSAGGSGSPTITGTGALPPISLATSGGGDSRVSGSGATSLSLTVAGTGQPTCAGSGEQQFSLTVAGDGTVTVTGTGATALQMGTSGDGGQVFNGTGSLEITLTVTQRILRLVYAGGTISDLRWSASIRDTPWTVTLSDPRWTATLGDTMDPFSQLSFVPVDFTVHGAQPIISSTVTAAFLPRGQEPGLGQLFGPAAWADDVPVKDRDGYVWIGPGSPNVLTPGEWDLWVNYPDTVATVVVMAGTIRVV